MAGTRRALAGGMFIGFAGPTVAFAQTGKLTAAQVFFNAAPAAQAVMVGLLAAGGAAIVVGLAKLASGRRLAGGSAYLSSLRWGAPLLGLLGASYTGLQIFLGIANLPTPPSMTVLAPGLAEVALLLGLGFVTGAVALAFHWAVEARIDRQVLS